MSTFARGFCEYTGTPVYSSNSQYQDMETIESYDGAEIHGLNKGKRTYIIKVKSTYFQDEFPVGEQFLEQANFLGSYVSSRMHYMRIITQDEDVLEEILNTIPKIVDGATNGNVVSLDTVRTGNGSICTYGSELLSIKTLELQDSTERLTGVGTEEDINNVWTIVPFQVVTKLKTLDCDEPMVYTEKGRYATDRPMFMGEEVFANCRL